MYDVPYGPRGAEDERNDFWDDVAEGADMLPQMPPEKRMNELASLAGFDAQEPYGPAAAYGLGLDTGDASTENEAEGEAESEVGTEHPQEFADLNAWADSAEDELPEESSEEL